MKDPEFKESKPGRGGRRPGAGRKPKPRPEQPPAGPPPAESKPPPEPPPPGSSWIIPEPGQRKAVFEGLATLANAKPPAVDPPAHPRRSELAATAAAANAGWAIPEIGRQKAVYECLAILADPLAGGRLKMTAVRVLAAIERLNQTLAAKPTAASPIGPDVEALLVLCYGDDAAAADSGPAPPD